MSTTELLLFVLNTVLVGAAVGVLVFVNKLDKRAKDDAERLYQALPPIWQTAILKLIDAADALVRVSREVTDGKPNDE
jgi:uncharacterized membrane protein